MPEPRRIPLPFAAVACWAALSIPAGDAGAAGPATDCGPQLRGSNGADQLLGEAGGELLRGRGGADEVHGRAGMDCLFGGSGPDALNPGPGADLARGGHGDDVIEARDPESDMIYCGEGDDRALVDPLDTLPNEGACEQVVKVPAPSDPPDRDPPDPDPDPSWQPFSAASPWNTKVDRSRTAPNSAVMIRKLVSDGPPSPATPATTRNWGIPIYHGTATDPLYRLEFTGGFDYTREIDDVSIHVPAGAQPSRGSDGVMWIMDHGDGFLYATQRTSVDHAARVISAWKGYRLDADGLGFRYPSGPPTGIQPIRPEELAAGYVDHAMSMGVRCLSGHPVAPFDQSLTVGKICSGDVDPATTRLSMGNVVFLDMTHAEIDALGVPVWQEAILKGLADHGAVVGLNGGSAWALKFENPIGRTSLGEPDPYQAAGLPETLNFADALDRVGGWGAKLSVLRPFPRPCSGLC